MFIIDFINWCFLCHFYYKEDNVWPKWSKDFSFLTNLNICWSIGVSASELSGILTAKCRLASHQGPQLLTAKHTSNIIFIWMFSLVICICLFSHHREQVHVCLRAHACRRGGACKQSQAPRAFASRQLSFINCAHVCPEAPDAPGPCGFSFSESSSLLLLFAAQLTGAHLQPPASAIHLWL